MCWKAVWWVVLAVRWITTSPRATLSLSSTFSRVTLDELWGYIGCLTMNDLVATANWVPTNAGGGSPDSLHVLYDR